MISRNAILVGIGVVAVSFAFGRYSVSTSSKAVTHTQVTENKEDKTNTDLSRDRQRETVVTEVTLPDGRKEKTTKTTETSVTNKTTQKDTTDAIQTHTQAETSTSASRGSPLGIYGLVGVDFGSRLPVYGGAVTKQIVGPIYSGAWGLSSGAFGVSLGLSF